MNSRERVLQTMKHEEPDKVPIDLGGYRSSGIMAIAYKNVRDYLGLEQKTIYVYDIQQQLAIVDDDVLERFGGDTIEMGRGFSLDESDWQDWTLPDGTPCKVPAWVNLEHIDQGWIIRSATGMPIALMPPSSYYFDQTNYPFAEVDDLDAIPKAFAESMWTAVPSPPGPLTATDDCPDPLQEGARRLRARTDRAIVGIFGGNLLEIGQFLYRNDVFYMLLAAEPKRAHAFLERLVELHLQNLEKYLAAVGKYIDIILFGDDLGMQTGPQISPKMYVEFFKPRHAAMFQRAKELADVKVKLHCCGGVRPLLPHLIEAGLDAINPVQTNCAGMDPKELKAEFGKDLVFWGGGCDTQRILPTGTPEQVRRHVLEQLEIFAPSGGYVFQQIHNVMADVPPQNIVAMYDAVAEFNK